MGIYKALTINEFVKDEYALVPLREHDILAVAQWRNEQLDVLRQHAILTDHDQNIYYETRVVPSFSEAKPGIILFSYLQHSVCIGYGGLTDIDWENRRAELSFLLQTERTRDVQQYRRDFACFLHMIKTVAFDELKFDRIVAETYDIRPEHVRTLEENGFVLEGRLKQHVVIRGQLVDSLLHGCLKDTHHV
jgi:RimJ/RimL family protein N-acetyltransferase